MVEKVFTVNATVAVAKDEGCAYELYDEVYSAENFIMLYEINTLEDLELLHTSKLWLRYLAEAAELIFTDGDSNTIHFRKFRSNTMVYSLDLNYYTEVNKVLNMTDHFKAFIGKLR